MYYDPKNTAIYLEGVSKYYPIYKNPKDRLKELIFKKKYHEKFWALRNINLTVKKGETLGIIGENGAGKSTLLKIISHTLTPSSGKVIVNGRVSPILELGMGFHPELTGRENIFLAGTLLGLSQKEIEAKMDTIIDFSELKEFIDQPVKFYSSGMYIRLAFSIATSIDPDILVIDEALSVGDAYFQKKSLNKILEFKRNNKTIVFCSHSTYHISHVCDRAIWLEQGQIRMDGNRFEVVAEYEQYCRTKEAMLKQEKKSIEIHSPLVLIKTIHLNQEIFKRGDVFKIQICLDNPQNIPFHVGVIVTREDEVVCFAASTYHDGKHPFSKAQETVTFFVPHLPLLHGKYRASILAIDESANIAYDIKDVFFQVKKCEEELGLVWVEHEWK